MDDIEYVRKPHVKCPRCKGSGKAPEGPRMKCDWCDGSKKVTTLTRKEKEPWHTNLS